MKVMHWWVAFVLVTLLPHLALALGTGQSCETVAANQKFTNGQPAFVLPSATYPNNGACTVSSITDITYQNPAPLPGTYVSWADSEPLTSSLCTLSKLNVYVWDMSSSPPVFQGSLSSTGKWIANPDPVRNPGVSSICHIAPIRAETMLGFTPGRTYRFAAQALTASIRRRLAIANAPVPTRANVSTGVNANGQFFALLASSGADMSLLQPWPTSSFVVKLDGASARVTRGGDLSFQSGEFFQPHLHYQKVGGPNFGWSNAALVSQGATAGFADFSCQAFVMTRKIYAAPEFTYLDENTTSYAYVGASYCLLDERNNMTFKVHVFNSDPDASAIVVVGAQEVARSGYSSWNCLDGFCDDQVAIASTYTQHATSERDEFVGKTFNLLHKARACIEARLGRTFPGPFPMRLYGETFSPEPNGAMSYGAGGPSLVSVGFQGFWRPGQKRVTNPSDLRYEAHEAMHVFNAHSFVAELPDWLDEGFAIESNARVTCNGDPDYMGNDGTFYNWSPGDHGAHAVGSEFFRRLETDYFCGEACVAGMWRALVDDLGADTRLTNGKIKAAMERYLGTSLNALFAHVALRWAVPGDVNGDGYADIALVGGQGWTTVPIAVSNGDGTFHYTNAWNPSLADWAVTPNVKVVTGDFNGDGASDLFFTGPAGWGGPGVGLSNRDSTFSPSGPSLPTFAYWGTSPGVQVIPGDVNGDGLDDVTLSAPGWGSFPVAYATGGGEFGVNNVQVNNSSDPNLALFPTWAQWPNMRVIPGDFNGDGFGDFALTGSAGVNSLPVLYNGPSGPRSATNEPLADFPWWATYPNATPVSGDFNGDGRDDVALVGGEGWWTVPVAFSYGNGTFWVTNEVSWDFAAWAQWPNAKPIVGDFNGDGLDDIALLGSDSFGSIPVALSNGNGTFNVSAPPLDSFPWWASAPGVVALSGHQSQ